MADDLLQRRVEAARAELEVQLDPFPPDLEAIRVGAPSRRRALVATTAAVALIAGGVLVGVWPERERSVVAGPSPEAANTANAELLAPGQARQLPRSPLAGRSTLASVWTGTEMLVWGGESPEGPFDDGAAYDPRRETWRLLPDGPLAARNAPAAVWTGTEMILWGGHRNGVDYDDGAAFDPVAGTWRSIPEAPMVSAGRPIAVWTGAEMLVLAGFNGHNAAAYDPATGQWRLLPDLPGQLQAPEPAMVWTGSRLVAALTYPGGQSTTGFFALDPAGEGWTELPRFGEGQIRLAWTGGRLLAVVGRTAALLDPDTDEWTSAFQAPEALTLDGAAVSVWTGTELLLWSGGNDALVVDPAGRTWRATPAGLERRVQPAAVWADGVFLTWGGFPDRSDGVMLRPSASSGAVSEVVTLPASAEPAPDLVPVVGPDGVLRGFMDLNAPPAVWDGRSLPVQRVEDGDGNPVGYFGCRFLERGEVERDDFDADASCPTVTTAVGR